MQIQFPMNDSARSWAPFLARPRWSTGQLLHSQLQDLPAELPTQSRFESAIYITGGIMNWIRIDYLLRELYYELTGDRYPKSEFGVRLVHRVISELTRLLSEFPVDKTKQTERRALEGIVKVDDHLKLSDWLQRHWKLSKRIGLHLEREYVKGQLDLHHLFELSDDQLYQELRNNIKYMGPINAQAIIDARKEWREQEDT